MGLTLTPQYKDITIDSLHSSDEESIKQKKVVVHLHLFYVDMLPFCMDYLSRIPIDFDILVSIPEDVECSDDEIRTQFKSLGHLKNITIAVTPNRGRDLAPMLCTFKEQIMQYDVLLHLHTKKSLHDNSLANWCEFIFQHLMPSEKAIEGILNALNTEHSIMMVPNFYYDDSTGWASNLPYAQKVIEDAGLDISLAETIPAIRYSQGSMMWCRTDALKHFFKLNYDYTDFPEEPLPTDATIAHALERLFTVWGSIDGKPCGILYLSKYEASLVNRVIDNVKDICSSMANLQNICGEQTAALVQYDKMSKDYQGQIAIKDNQILAHENTIKTCNETIQQIQDRNASLAKKNKRLRHIISILACLLFAALVVSVIALTR